MCHVLQVCSFSQLTFIISVYEIDLGITELYVYEVKSAFPSDFLCSATHVFSVNLKLANSIVTVKCNMYVCKFTSSKLHAICTFLKSKGVFTYREVCFIHRGPISKLRCFIHDDHQHNSSLRSYIHSYFMFSIPLCCETYSD